MIDLTIKTEWQFTDEELGINFPWYTKPALNFINSLNLENKIVFEYGLGSSSVWWAKKCKALYGVDSDAEYVQAVKNATDHKATVWYESTLNEYIGKPLQLGLKFDIIIIDGVHREDCVKPALECLKKKGIIIYDNWMQESVDVQSKETQDILLSMKHEIFPQENHDDWKTLIVFK